MTRAALGTGERQNRAMGLSAASAPVETLGRNPAAAQRSGRRSGQVVLVGRPQRAPGSSMRRPLRQDAQGLARCPSYWPPGRKSAARVQHRRARPAQRRPASLSAAHADLLEDELGAASPRQQRHATGRKRVKLVRVIVGGFAVRLCGGAPAYRGRLRLNRLPTILRGRADCSCGPVPLPYPAMVTTPEWWVERETFPTHNLARNAVDNVWNSVAACRLGKQGISGTHLERRESNCLAATNPSQFLLDSAEHRTR